jgi:hypothetical protein
MKITADIIRRFPFAVNPARISDRLQREIASDMHRSVTAEGHSKRLPPSVLPNQLDGLQRLAEAEAAVFRRLMAGDRTAWQIVQMTKHSKAEIERALNAMVADGRVIKGDKLRANAGHAYTINSNYMPEGSAA